MIVILLNGHLPNYPSIYLYLCTYISDALNLGCTSFFLKWAESQYKDLTSQDAENKWHCMFNSRWDIFISLLTPTEEKKHLGRGRAGEWEKCCVLLFLGTTCLPYLRANIHHSCLYKTHTRTSLPKFWHRWGIGRKSQGPTPNWEILSALGSFWESENCSPLGVGWGWSHTHAHMGNGN